MSIVAADKTSKYLTVLLRNEFYGISVLKVREIICLQKITPIPQLPAYVKGVINLRGRVIPVVDLRIKFGVEDARTDRTCIVVVQVSVSNDRTIPMGMVVDGVEEVVTLAAKDIEPTPEFGTSLDTAFIRGMAKVRGQVHTLLDIDRVVKAEVVEAALQAA